MDTFGIDDYSVYCFANKAALALGMLGLSMELRQELANKGAVDTLLTTIRMHQDKPTVLEQVGLDERSCLILNLSLLW